MLASAARERGAPPPPLRRLLDFLVRQVYGSAAAFVPYGAAGPYNPLCRALAGIAAFDGVAVACTAGAHSPAFAADLYGGAACQVAMVVTPGGGGGAELEWRLVDSAAGVVCMLLQADATALAATLDSSRLSQHHPRRVCLSAAAVLTDQANPHQAPQPDALPTTDVDSPNASRATTPTLLLSDANPRLGDTHTTITTAACEAALERLDQYACTPAAYHAVAGCPHPAVSLALLLAAAHVADLEPGPGTDPWVRGGVGGGAPPPPEFLTALHWPVRPRPDGQPSCGVAVRTYAGLTLEQLRQAAGAWATLFNNITLCLHAYMVVLRLVTPRPSLPLIIGLGGVLIPGHLRLPPPLPACTPAPCCC